MTIPRSILPALIALTLPIHGQGQEKSGAQTEPQDGDVWCGVFVGRAAAKAETKTKTKETTLTAQLAKAFPEMKHFEPVGESQCSVYKEYESWVVPSKQLFLKIDSLGPQVGEKGIHLHVQLWQREHVILKADAILRQKPVFIAGPKWGDGRLVMVLKLADPVKPQ